MSSQRWVSACLVAGLFFQGAPRLLGDEKRAPVVTFGALEATSAEAARSQAEAWLKQVGKTDAATTERMAAIWKSDRPVLDRLADTFALGDAKAARLLADAADPRTPAPTEVPAVLKDPKATAFYRANMSLIYARLLSNRRIHEEALEALKGVGAEQVVDPAAYLFHRAVCEHAMLAKDQAWRTISRLLDEAVGAPDRYKTVGALMLLDMQTWKDKDLGSVARKMGNVERRLELARGGPQTQKLQKEIVSRLDELIKELENKAKGSGKCNGGSCPGGAKSGSGGGANPSSPMQDSQIANNGGPGHVDIAKIREHGKGWGKLSARDRERVLQDLTRGLSASNREAVRNYLERIAAVEKANR
jgi:hypothetical protein